jgi:DNA helicase-2/ATP-dependent DNA helicase PcrA
VDVTHILEGMNDRQREAVSSPLGNSLVLAGAGSGKTRVLVHRISWLVEVEDVSPHGVLAVTFTNKAASEMRHRVEQLLGISVRPLWIGTFHGLAHRLLRIHWREAKIPQSFQVLDSDDQLRLVKRVMKMLDLDEQKWPSRQAVWFINTAKDEGRRPRHIDTGGDLFNITHLRVYEAYEEACQRGGLLDFSELILRSHELWLENDDLLRHYQNRFSQILVDEFQDTNAIQYAWLKVLGSRAGLMAVGDDDQSIYGWRGARVEHIQRFSKEFQGVTTYRLEQNYRSTGNILKAANALIDKNQDRLGKRLWTAGEDGDAILLYAAYNELDEARFIAERTREWIDGGASPGDVALLYRSNAQSRVLEEALLRLSIPYRIYGGLRFFERAEIRNALAYMRLVANADSDAAVERVINTPPRGIGDKTVERLRQHAREQDTTLWRAANDLVADRGPADRGPADRALAGRAANAVKGFIELIDSLTEQCEGKNLEEIVRLAIDNSGLMEFHGSEKGERGLARKENLEELVAACGEFGGAFVLPIDPQGLPSQGTEDLLSEFLDHAALETGEHQADSNASSVQLMTLHSAKGLEFPLVFMAGVEEGLFPHRMSLEEPGRLEEERRLCYVGITRAMKQLYFTYAETRRLHGSESYNKPSRFIADIPADLMQEVRIRNEVTRPLSPAWEDDEGSLRLGQRVAHPRFGEGVVLNCEGHGERTRVEVNFEQVGPKILMLSHANLELLNDS